MKNKQLLNEQKQLMKIAGLLVEARNPAYGGTDSIPDFEFEVNGKEYMASISIDFNFDWDSEDGIYNYDHTVEVDKLAVSDGNEYIPTEDTSEIAAVQNLLNTDPELSRRIEKYVDTSSAEPEVDDSYDDLDEDSDYDMGTPSGDTDAMNIGEANKMYSYTTINDMDDVLYLVDELIDYMGNRADSEDEGGMNEEGQLLKSLEDAKSFLEGLQRGKK